MKPNTPNIIVRLASLAMLFVAVQEYAQAASSIVANVTDSSGGVIPGVEVKLADVRTGTSRSVVSDSTGRSIFSSLSPSEYIVSAEFPGFKKYAVRINLRVDQTAAVDIVLQVGEATETITVQGDSVQPDTVTPTLQQVIEQDRVVELPLDGRNAASLITLVAGTVNAPSEVVDQGPTKTFPGGLTIAVNGARQNQTNYNLDGGNNNDIFSNINNPFPFPDAVQEFSVQTSNYSAQFGKNAGAVVNVETKSGTQNYHGEFFGFHRNKSLNARNFFQAKRDALKRTQFGATFGGPIPLINDTFVFGGWQSTRVRSQIEGLSAFVPTDANRAGDFSALLDATSPNNPVGKVVQIVDPLTGEPFPGNIIPQDRLNPAALKFLDHLPRAGGNGRVRFSRPVGQDFDEFVIRFDHLFRGQNKFTGRYLFNEFDNISGFDGSNLLSLTAGSNIRFQNLLLGYNHIFSPNIINDFRFSYLRSRSFRGQPDSVPNAADFGVDVLQPERLGIGQVRAAGFFGVGDFVSALFVRDGYNFADNVSWIIGRHTISFGGEYERDKFVMRNKFFQAPFFIFTNDITNNSLASLLLGKLRNFTQGAGFFQDGRLNVFSLYVQDEFRATDRLSVTLGLRWDPAQPWQEIRGRIEQFRPDAFLRGETSEVFVNAPPGLFFRGDRGVPQNGESSDYNNFAPRVGVAYDVSSDHKTVLRGGVGLFFDSRTNVLRNTRTTGVTPFAPIVAVTDPKGSFSNPDVPNVFNSPFPPPKDVAFPRPVLVQAREQDGFRTPLTYNWNLTLEHRLTPGLLARASYVGSHGSHLVTNVNLNPARFIPGSNLPTDQRRLFSGFSNIFLGTSSENSSYNALQLGLEKRPFGGSGGGPALLNDLTLLANYTYSRSISTLPFGIPATGEIGGVGDEGLTASALPFDDPNRIAFDTGPSNFDHTHVFVVSWVWELPKFGSISNPWLRNSLGEWELTGIYRIQSGGPLTILAGQDRSRTGLGADRGVFLGTDLGTGSRGPGGCGANEAPCKNFLDPKLFALPQVGEFGNIGKGAFRGPDFWTVDLGIFKNFSVTEEFRLQFRMEFFNIFNNVNFNDPNNIVNSAGFGGIRSAAPPRIGQVALKIFF